MIIVTWYLLPDMCYLILVTRYLLSETCYLIPATWYMLKMLKNGFLIIDVWYHVPLQDLYLLIFTTRYLICDFFYLQHVSDTSYRTLNNVSWFQGSLSEKKPSRIHSLSNSINFPKYLSNLNLKFLFHRRGHKGILMLRRYWIFSFFISI